MLAIFFLKAMCLQTALPLIHTHIGAIFCARITPISYQTHTHSIDLLQGFALCFSSLFVL